MGCCFSSHPKSAAKNPRNEDQNAKPNRAPPPCNPLPEEESVKEVLSETPSVPRKPAILRTRQESNDPKKIMPSLPTFPTIQDEKLKAEAVFKKPIASFNSEELSEEGSELCSTHSGSVSTATYYTEKNDDDGQRSFRQGSLPGDSRRGRLVGQAPAKRSEPSPGRATRTGSGIGTRGLGANGQKRDSGEISGRRSRSPANRGDSGGAKTGMVRSGPAKKGGKSPGRVKAERNDKILKLEDFGGSNRESRENQWPPTRNESLENPLVSLECFIFL